MKLYQKIIAGIIIIILLFIGRLLINAGVFTKISPHFNGNITEVNGFEGAEDITIDQEMGHAFVSSNDFTNPKSTKGAIFLLNLNDSVPKPLNISGVLPFDFHPHGISFFKSEKAQKSLFVINHRAKGQFIEIFDWDGTALKHKKSIADPLIISPNDVLAVGENSFYFTNDHNEAPSKWRSNKDLLQIPMGNICYFDGKTTKIVAGGFLYANGINISLDKKTVFMAEVSNKKIKVYERNTQNGSLTEKDEIAIHGADNIEIDAQGNLWAGCHVNLLAFLAHSKDQTELSPSEIVKIKYNGIGNYSLESIYQNNGKPLSGASVGTVYQNKLLIGSVFENKILLGNLK